MTFITFERRDITCSKNRKNLVSTSSLRVKNSLVNEKIPDAVVRKFSVNKGFLTLFCKIHRKTPTLESQLNNYLNSIEQFPEFQSDDVNQKFRITF